MRCFRGVFCALCCLILAYAKESEASRFLSTIQQERLWLDRLYHEHQSSVMRLQNIAPIEMGYQDSFNHSLSPTIRNRGFYVGINQPLFKSGGIMSSIWYAYLNEAYNKQAVVIEERSLTIQSLRLITQIQKINLEIDQQRLRTQNATLDVLRKKEQYEAGFIDSSTLDNAILDRNQAQRQAIAMRNTQNSYRYELSKISDIDENEVVLPSMQWFKEGEYLEQNLQIQYAKLDHQQKGALYYKSIADFLPQISLQARYNKDIDSQKDHDATLSLVFSLPILDVGIYDKIQIAKIERLRSALNVSQMQREHKELYRKQLQDRQDIESRRLIAHEDLALYSSLLLDSVARSSAGDLTDYDVKIIQNSKAIQELELKILDYEEYILFLELYQNIKEAS